MKQIIALVPFLAGIAAAQEDSYKSLAVGDRIQVTFRSGGSLVGTIVPPPSVGPLASRPKAKPVDVKAAGAPFTLYVFVKKGDPSSDAQSALVDSWRREHPEASVTTLAMEDKGAAELIKTYNVVAVPTVVLQDTATGRAQTQVGLQSAERLSSSLARLRARIEEEKVDFEKEEYITLDVRLEYPGLNGTMSVNKKDIREVRKLQKLDEQTRKRLEEEHRKIREAQMAEEAARREAEAKRSAETAADIERAEKDAADAAANQDEGQALLKKAEEIKAQQDLLKQFPPDQWNEERRQAILNKFNTKIPLSLEERAFLDQQAKWSDAVKAEKSRKEKEEKEKASREEK